MYPYPTGPRSRRASTSRSPSTPPTSTASAHRRPAGCSSARRLRCSTSLAGAARLARAPTWRAARPRRGARRLRRGRRSSSTPSARPRPGALPGFHTSATTLWSSGGRSRVQLASKNRICAPHTCVLRYPIATRPGPLDSPATGPKGKFRDTRRETAQTARDSARLAPAAYVRIPSALACRALPPAWPPGLVIIVARRIQQPSLLV